MSARAAAVAVLRIVPLALVIAVLLLLGARPGDGAQAPSDGSSAASGGGASKGDTATKGGGAARGDVERGRYLTHDVAMCVQCHTPRNAAGELDQTRLFAGATIPLSSPFPGQVWATEAPAIAGLGVFNEEDEMSLLTTGARRDGKRPRPPMPSFRMKPDDARAVIAYLRSLERGDGD
jgi:mono/diheme cytochrome c family protein